MTHRQYRGKAIPIIDALISSKSPVKHLRAEPRDISTMRQSASTIEVNHLRENMRM